MNQVKSKDGTTIAYDRVGQGPALICVGGALSTRTDAAQLLGRLSQNFTAYAYDRRGRGDSSDTAPYAAEREIEDLEALIREAGGSAFVFGHSSGAVLGLEAARRFQGMISKLAVYEPPFVTDDSRPPVTKEDYAELADLISSGRRGEAVSYHMLHAVGVPAEVVAQIQNSPMWPELEANAHTLIYDWTIMGDTMSGKPLTREPWASITVPTLVMDGGASPAFMHRGCEALAEFLPHAQHRRFPGQGHGIADELLVPALVEFFVG